MDLFEKIKAAMQEAEEIGGPEGAEYRALMARIVGEAYSRYQAAAEAEHAKKRGTVLACTTCGCTDIETESWVPLNGPIMVNGLGEIALLSTSSESTVFCQQCNSHNKWWCQIDLETGECANHANCKTEPQPYDEKRVLPDNTDA